MPKESLEKTGALSGSPLTSVIFLSGHIQMIAFDVVCNSLYCRFVSLSLMFCSIVAISIPHYIP